VLLQLGINHAASLHGHCSRSRGRVEVGPVLRDRLAVTALKPGVVYMPLLMGADDGLLDGWLQEVADGILDKEVLEVQSCRCPEISGRCDPVLRLVIIFGMGRRARRCHLDYR